MSVHKSFVRAIRHRPRSYLTYSVREGSKGHNHESCRNQKEKQVGYILVKLITDQLEIKMHVAEKIVGA